MWTTVNLCFAVLVFPFQSSFPIIIAYVLILNGDFILWFKLLINCSGQSNWMLHLKLLILRLLTLLSWRKPDNGRYYLSISILFHNNIVFYQVHVQNYFKNVTVLSYWFGFTLHLYLGTGTYSFGEFYFGLCDASSWFNYD